MLDHFKFRSKISSATPSKRVFNGFQIVLLFLRFCTSYRNKQRSGGGATKRVAASALTLKLAAALILITEHCPPSVPVRFVQFKRSFDLPFHSVAASAAPTHVFAAATTTPFPRQRHHHRKPSIGATADLVGKEGTCCWCAIFTHLCESSPPVSQPVPPPWRRNTTHQHDELQRALSASPTLSIFTKTATQPSTPSPPHHTTTKRPLPLSSCAVRPPPLVLLPNERA